MAGVYRGRHVDGQRARLRGPQRGDADCGLDQVCRAFELVGTPRINQRRPPGVCVRDRVPPVVALPTLPMYGQPAIGKLAGLPVGLHGEVADNRFVAEAAFWLDDAALPTKFTPGDGVALTELSPSLLGPDGPRTVALEAGSTASPRTESMVSSATSSGGSR